MMRCLLLSLVAFSVAACGVQRPLIRPKDIPAYEEQQRKKRAKIEEEQRQMEQEQLQRLQQQAQPESAN